MVAVLRTASMTFAEVTRRGIRVPPRFKGSEFKGSELLKS